MSVFFPINLKLLSSFNLISRVLLNPPTPTHRPPTNQPLTTNPPTQRPPTHLPTDPMILFKRLDHRKTFILRNTHTAETIISVYLRYLMNKSAKENVVAHKIRTEELMKYILLIRINSTAVLLPSYFKVIFYSWKFLLDQMFFSLHRNSLRFNLIRLPKQPSNKTKSDTV